ncbi:helix-turn-helix transcriptional regulator [Rhizobium rhizogenes]|uniref:helix-turn-helix transcriptional regulator n=1 Tax=Rhizobium rhizogenes TaxID=359 RepID=UPI0024BDBC50|nr:autoinducer binding domain-containing protein [Rhizobium rhizogenes]MDJ1638662.1 autoinducer binding domain-containing protein [Rhizobium rhizogenes]
MNISASAFETVFILIEAAATVTEALKIFQKHYHVAFVTYHLAQTIAGKIDAPFVRTTYPDAWVSKYLLNGFVSVDPIVREGFARQLPFDWREVEVTEEAVEFLQEAQRHDIGGQGYSMPIIDKVRRRALFSVNSRNSEHMWDQLIQQHREQWVELAHLIHRKAVLELYGQHDPITPLSLRELECLHWTALGKDYKEVAIILEISDHTARSYLKSARLKLGGSSNAAAVAKAIQLRMINP